MTLPATLAVWLVLVLLLGIEFFVGGAIAMVVGIGMAIIVALTYMRLARIKDVSPAFALATIFWLMVLFGLGSLDSATRRDIAVSVSTDR